MTAHPAFEKVRQLSIPTLNIDLEEYRHYSTGAVHYHLKADNPENVFLVALRTVPMDHKGVAHILEHTALCGSKHYPVRDPFFMMTRRSLNTFMNAFTSNDWTAYPFASLNRKDFNNLLDVYLDAVFFARLDELDFLQEGHRLEFSKPDDRNSPLEFKGVVFNEMKGAMSSINSVLWQTLCKHLFPSTTYHFNSGGDPEYIIDLSYEELQQFYRKHYHPSNAIFMTYGNIPAAEHQAHFEEKALKHFSPSGHIIHIPDEKRYHAPVRAEEFYPLDGNESTQAQTHLLLAWLLGQNTSLHDVLSAHMLSYILMENSASPLQNYLETTELGSAPSPMCGMEDSYHELVFVCGLAGSEATHADQFENEVLALLQKVADDGLPQERLEAILHQMELHQREITGDGYPYGLQLILTALPSITHRGDPAALLDLEPALEQLRADIKKPGFVKKLVENLLINNNHRLRLVMRPDTGLSQRQQAAEKNRLEKIRQHLSEADTSTIIAKARALAERQKHIDNPDILPKVTLTDVPAALNIPAGNTRIVNGIPFHTYDQGTNGITYQQLLLPLPAIPADLLPYLPLYTRCLTEVGIDDKDFTEVQNWQSAIVGSISAYSSLRGAISTEQEVIGYMVLSAKALSRNHAAMAELLKATLQGARFDEYKRIREIVSQTRLRKEDSITGNGHGLAMNNSCSLMSPLARWQENWGGMEGIRKIRELDDDIASEEKLQELCLSLSRLHRLISQMPLQVLNISEREHQADIEHVLKSLWAANNTLPDSLTLEPVRGTSRQAWLASTQVNFCAKAYPTVPAGHADAPALTVLGGFLRNGFLHTAIREKGGAYGSGASQDSSIAAFRFYSYRDPRITGTLDDFDQSIQWMLEQKHSPAALEEAILGVIGSIDKPGSPAGEAKQAFHNTLFGRSPEQRQAFRQKILQVTLDDLQRVTQTYLRPELASIGIISSEMHRQELEGLGLDLRSL